MAATSGLMRGALSATESTHFHNPSGSEDGTLRLWQTVVGKTYGLWKCVDSVADSAPLIKPEVAAI
jgi:hypothetical protein